MSIVTRQTGIHNLMLPGVAGSKTSQMPPLAGSLFPTVHNARAAPIKLDSVVLQFSRWRSTWAKWIHKEHQYSYVS